MNEILLHRNLQHEKAADLILRLLTPSELRDLDVGLAVREAHFRDWDWVQNPLYQFYIPQSKYFQKVCCRYLLYVHTNKTSTQWKALNIVVVGLQLYQTSRGYFVVTPESRRLRKSSSSEDSNAPRTMLLSTDEAISLVHGEMETVPDGERTHQAIQTNLADVICGGQSTGGSQESKYCIVGDKLTLS